MPPKSNKGKKPFKASAARRAAKVLELFQERHLEEKPFDSIGREAKIKPETAREYLRAASLAADKLRGSNPSIPKSLRPHVQRLLEASGKGILDSEAIVRAGDLFERHETRELATVLQELKAHSGELRQEAVETAARRTGLSPETVKDVWKAAAFVATESPESPLFGHTVPKSSRAGVSRIKRALGRGVLARSLVRETGDAFLKQTVTANIPRFDLVHKITDPKTISYRKKFARQADRVGEIMGASRDSHPVRAVEKAWSLAGKKLHWEKPWVLQNVPRERLDETMRELHHYNYVQAQAAVQYAHANSEVLKFTSSAVARDIANRDPQMGKALENLRKAAQRWNFPHQEFRKIPYETEDVLIARWREVKEIARRAPAFLEGLTPLQKFITETGRRLEAARKVYHAAEKIRESHPDLSRMPKASMKRPEKKQFIPQLRRDE